MIGKLDGSRARHYPPENRVLSDRLPASTFPNAFEKDLTILVGSDEIDGIVVDEMRVRGNEIGEVIEMDLRVLDRGSVVC